MDFDGDQLFCKAFNPVQDILKDSVVESLDQPPKLDDVTALTDSLILCPALRVNQTLIDSRRVTCVINAAPELPDPPLEALDLINHRVPVLDSSASDILAHFDETADLIRKVGDAGGRTVVYCVAAVSRSPSLCMAYLMKHEGLTLRQAYQRVKERRPRVKPNCAFFRQLIEYERALRGGSTVAMVHNCHVGMEIPDVYEGDYGGFRKKRAGRI